MDFLNYEFETYFKQPLSPPQHNIIVVYHTSNHRLAIELGRWPTTPIPIDNKLCYFFSYNVVEDVTHFVLEIKFLEDNVALGSLSNN